MADENVVRFRETRQLSYRVNVSFRVLVDGMLVTQSSHLFLYSTVVLNNFQYYDSNGGTEIIVTGMLETQSKDVPIRRTIDLCNSVTSSSGNSCPYDGTYDFNTTVPLSGNAGSWWSSGFGATANVEMVAHDGTRIGNCKVKFATPVHGIYGFGISSKLVCVVAITVVGLVIFVSVFMVFAKQVFAAQKLRRMGMVPPDDDDDSMVTKATVKTSTNKEDDGNESDTYDGTYDDTTRSSVSRDIPGSSWSYRTGGTWSYKTYASNYTTDASARTADTSFYTYTTETGKEGGISGAFAKAWRIGGLVVERIVNGKPLRTPPRTPPSPPVQEQESEKPGIESETNATPTRNYFIMKDEVSPPSVTSSKPSKTSEQVGANVYNRMDDGSIELATTSSTLSDVDLSCDSMDVQAHERKSRYACGATEAVANNSTATATDALAGVRAAAEAMQAMGIGFMGKAIPDASWLTSSNRNTDTDAAPEQRQEEVMGDEYHDMKVYTIGNDNEDVQYYGRVTVTEGNRPISYWPSSSDDDSSRENATPDDSSIVPAVPRRQQVTLNLSPEQQTQGQDKNAPPPTSQGGYVRSDSSSVHAVLHGSRVDANHHHTENGTNSGGAFVRWEDQVQWKRSEKWTAASLNRFGEL